jgi:hypothetical protein
MNSTKIKRVLLTAVLLFSISVNIQAQDEGIATEEGPPNPSDAPVDGGISLLLAAGVAYGIRKQHKRSQEK